MVELEFWKIFLIKRRKSQMMLMVKCLCLRSHQDPSHCEAWEYTTVGGQKGSQGIKNMEEKTNHLMWHPRKPKKPEDQNWMSGYLLTNIRTEKEENWPAGDQMGNWIGVVNLLMVSPWEERKERLGSLPEESQGHRIFSRQVSEQPRTPSSIKRGE